MYFKLDYDTRKLVAKATCGKTPPGEMVLRAAHCNFNCIPYFAAGYSHIERIKRRIKSDIVKAEHVDQLVSDFKIFVDDEKGFISEQTPSEFNWLRVVGGEPILNMNNLKFLLEFLVGIDDYRKSFGGKVIIQTNGFFWLLRDTKTLNRYSI